MYHPIGRSLQAVLMELRFAQWSPCGFWRRQTDNDAVQPITSRLKSMGRKACLWIDVSERHDLRLAGEVNPYPTPNGHDGGVGHAGRRGTHEMLIADAARHDDAAL
jgi:hypothetical protein